MAQQEQKAKQATTDMRMVASKFKQEGLKAILPQMGPGPVTEQLNSIKPNGGY